MRRTRSTLLARPVRPVREPTIALINIVFLMLVFFLVAGTIARPLDPDVQLVQAADLNGRAPSDAIVLHASGRLSFRGQTIGDAADYWVQRPDPTLSIARIIPDRDVSAHRLLTLANRLRSLGAERVVILTERAVP